MYIPKLYPYLKSPVGTHPGQSPRVASVRAYRAHLELAASVRRANIEAGVECVTLNPSPTDVNRCAPLEIVDSKPACQSKNSQRPMQEEPCGLAMALLIAAGGGITVLGTAWALIFGLQMGLEYLAQAMGG